MLLPVAAAATTEAAPWWGVPVLAGIFLILVAIVTFLANYWIKRQELKRADFLRWDSDILECSLILVKACRTMTLVGHENSDEYIADVSKREEELMTLMEQIDDQVQRLSYIASDKVGASARQLVQVAVNVEQSLLIGDMSGYVNARANIPERVGHFRKVVRNELRAKK